MSTDPGLGPHRRPDRQQAVHRNRSCDALGRAGMPDGVLRLLPRKQQEAA